MLLDALTYIIDADNRKLDQEVKGSEKKVDDLGKSMTAAEKRAADMQKRMTDGFKRLGGAILATVAVSKVLAGVTELAQTAEAVRNTSNAIGVAVEDVDAFGKSIELMGGDAQGARDSLTDMAESIGEAMADVESGRAKTFKALGISLKDVSGQTKNAVDVMSELAGAVEGMSREQAVFRIKELGITDNRTVELLLKGRQELDRMMRVQKEQGVITKETTERAQKYTEAMARFRQGTQNSMQAVAAVMLPILTKMLNGLSAVFQWMSQHGDFIKGFFIALGLILAVTYGPAVVSAAIATWALIAPFVAVGVVIAAVAGAFALLYDDIVNFMEGNDSLIGQISKNYPAIGEIAKALYNTVSGIFKLLTGDFEGARENLTAAADAIKNVFGAMGDSIINVLDSLFQWFGAGPGAATKMADSMVSVFDGMAKDTMAIFQRLIQFVSQAWDWITGIYDKSAGMVSGLRSWLGGKLGFGSADESVLQGDEPRAPTAPAVPQAKAHLSAVSENPLNAVTSQAISNTTNARSETNVSVGQVTVQTQATDAAGISSDISSELSGQLKNLQTESASGVAR